MYCVDEDEIKMKTVEKAFLAYYSGAKDCEIINIIKEGAITLKVLAEVTENG